VVNSETLQAILAFGPVFLLIAARAFAMLQTAPIISSEGVPAVVRITLAGFAAFAAMPTAEVFFAPGQPGTGFAALINGATGDLRWEPFSLAFLLLLVGEATIGIITGFFLTIILATFATAGQFFSLQMGLAASETFDPLSQIENPLMGQFLNLVAMLVFITIGGLQHLFLGFWRSVQTINILHLLEGREAVVSMMAAGLAMLFLDAIVISLPILGTLFLTSLTTGLISKAAPQINILSEGFPISILTAYVVIVAALPFMTETFAGIINAGFGTLESLFIQIGQPITGGDGF